MNTEELNDNSTEKETSKAKRFFNACSNYCKKRMSTLH